MNKGMSEMWWIISAAVIALVVVIIILVFFGGASGKLFGGVNEQIGGLKDSDGDGMSDAFDKCDCDPDIKDTIPEGYGECKIIPNCKP